MEYAEKEAESYKEETDKQRQFEEQKACWKIPWDPEI